ncbi:MAG: nickel pincer cofactor biosynthesis protein LarC [Nitrososphaerota archaeon]|nr:nickel pincer cofactor biosynthesis protein LarC [Aigarchaeota archaeon]MDW8076411.1 nickel pincer cofactor biosynthesis protein LarC [Nitrososphaerota archaeon]
MVIDCSVSGISGDMLLAALLDVGADENAVKHAIERIPKFLEGCKEITFRSEEVYVDELRAKRIKITSDDVANSRPAVALIDAVRSCVSDLNLSDSAASIAINAIELLARAEASVHGEPLESVHLHELGMADTVADIIGVAVALDSLGLSRESIATTRLAVGGGPLKLSHGVFPAPAPATLELLKISELPFSGGPVKGELATPTGVALLASMSSRIVQTYPPMIVERIGYGAGSIPHDGRLSVLRLLLGQEQRVHENVEEIMLLETNVDDVSGESLAYVAEKLLSEGALDVSIIQAIGKKGRPTSILRVLSRKGYEANFARMMMRELGTLGVRFITVSRFVATREESLVDVHVAGRIFKIRVKRSFLPGGELLTLKPEFEDLRVIARETGLSIREVESIVKKQLC